MTTEDGVRTFKQITLIHPVYQIALVVNKSINDGDR